MAIKNLDLDKLYENPQARIIISYGGKGLFTGVMKNDLTIAVASSYASLFKTQQMDQASELISKMSMLTPENIPNVSLKAPNLTSLIWQGVENPVFTVPLTLLCWRENQNILSEIKKLYSAVIPEKQKILGFNYLSAPLGYSANSGLLDSTPLNTITIAIGNWFLAPKMVMTNVSFDLARIASGKEGKPLYADGAITFKPYRDITFDEFNEYLRE